MGTGVPRSSSAGVKSGASRTPVSGALVDPYALVEWLPPQGMTGHFDYYDARAGGSYRMTLT